MTANEFAAICGNYTIPPALALEKDDLRAALKATSSVTP